MIFFRYMLVGVAVLCALPDDRFAWVRNAFASFVLVISLATLHRMDSLHRGLIGAPLEAYAATECAEAYRRGRSDGLRRASAIQHDLTDTLRTSIFAFVVSSGGALLVRRIRSKAGANSR